MASSETEIANLLHRYAERLDAGDLEGMAALFRHARIKLLRRADRQPPAGPSLLPLFTKGRRRHCRSSP